MGNPVNADAFASPVSNSSDGRKAPPLSKAISVVNSAL